MGSRVREKPGRLFEVFVKIAKPDGKSKEPYIIQRFPPDFDDKEALMMIPRFAYPCPTDVASSSAKSNVDHFTFVLTDLDSMFRFGHCRHATGHQTCLCIVSWLPWYEVCYKMLDRLAEIINRSEKNNVSKFLQAVYNQDVPVPRASVTIVADEDMFSYVAPDRNVLPSIPSSRNLTEYYNAVDPYNMMVIFASMLHERRIYMISKKLSRLTACIHAAEALLYPMYWQHLYIPVLPAHLIDYISAPMPYLIGIHSNLVEKLKQNRVDVGDAVVVDLDSNTITTQYDDLGDLPEDVSSYLKRNLKMDVVKNSMMKAGDAISTAFLHALVRLIGGYRDALKFRPGEPITFDPEAFVRSRPSQSTQEFLEGMLTLQIFQQFIYGRLKILNEGAGFRDVFEQQATLYADKLNSQSKYKEWLKSVKKSGKKGWNGLKVKVKEQGKRAMADFKTKLSGLTENEDRSGSNSPVSKGVNQPKPARPRPVTSNPENIKSSRPPRPPPPTRATQSEYERRNRSVTHGQDNVDKHYDDGQLHLSYPRVDVSLMTDSDIQAAMLKSASARMLPDESEQYSEDSDSESSRSETTSDGTSIAFDVLHSSDEDVQVIGPGNSSVHHLVPVPRRILHSVPDKSYANPTPLARSSVCSNLPQSSSKPEKFRSWPTTTALQDAPLIDFDSSESPTDSESFECFIKSPTESLETSFGTTSDKNESMNGGSSTDERSLQRNTKSRVSLTRSKAFRREAPVVPIRTQCADDSDDPDGPIGKDLTVEMFDTLSNSVHNSAAVPTGGATHSDPLSSHSPRRDNSGLLTQEWSLTTLAKGPSIRMPLTAQPLAMSYPNNPFLLGRSKTLSSVNQSTPSSTFTSNPQVGGTLNHHSNVSTKSGQFQNERRNVETKLPDSSKSIQKEHQKVISETKFQNEGKNVEMKAQATAPHSSKSNQNEHQKVLSGTKSSNQTRIQSPSHTRPQSSMSPRTPGMMNFTAPIPSSSTPMVRKNARVVHRPSSGGVNSNISSSSLSVSSSLKHSDFFGDFKDIDFTQDTSTDQPGAPQKARSCSNHVQSKWETFD